MTWRCQNIVLRDLTCVLFDQKLIVQLMNSHPCQHILTVQQCRILLTDIACCSLMRLDMTSMDKLWDLMIMLFKWQLYMIKEEPSRLLELTFRHMDGVAKLMPEMKKTLLIDSTKRYLIEFCDACTPDDIGDLLANLWHWMKPFNVKISILIRSGFQRSDGSFEAQPSQVHTEHFQDYLDNIGENVYAKNASSAKSKGSRRSSGLNRDEKMNSSAAISNELSSLADQLNITNEVVGDELAVNAVESATAENSDATEPNENVAESEDKSNKNDLLVDDVNCSMTVESPKSTKGDNTESGSSEFIHLKKTTTALQGYLEQFRNENNQSTDSNDGTANSFDATEELLKMLEKEPSEKN